MMDAKRMVIKRTKRIEIMLSCFVFLLDVIFLSSLQQQLVKILIIL